MRRSREAPARSFLPTAGWSGADAFRQAPRLRRGPACQHWPDGPGRHGGGADLHGAGACSWSRRARPHGGEGRIGMGGCGRPLSLRDIAAVDGRDTGFSGIPEPDAPFWREGRRAGPDTTERITLGVKGSVPGHFRQQGRGYRTRIDRVPEAHVRDRRRAGWPLERGWTAAGRGTSPQGSSAQSRRVPQSAGRSRRPFGTGPVWNVRNLPVGIRKPRVRSTAHVPQRARAVPPPGPSGRSSPPWAGPGSRAAREGSARPAGGRTARPRHWLPPTFSPPSLTRAQPLPPMNRK